jgi:hypothetical protein
VGVGESNSVPARRSSAGSCSVAVQELARAEIALVTLGGAAFLPVRRRTAVSPSAASMS